MDKQAKEAEKATLLGEIRALKKGLSDAREHNKVIVRQLAAKSKKPAKTKAARKPSGGHVRVILADSHGSHLDRSAWAACMADLKDLDVHEVILMGDHIECSGFLAEHHSPGTLSQATYSYSEDIDHASQWLDELQAVCPKASFHMLQGNHESRVERWIMQHSLAHNKDRKLLLEALDPEYRLRLKERGIKFYRRDEFNNTCRERGTLKLGNCFFVHEISTSVNAATVAVNKYAGNVVFGHSHRADISYSRKPGVGQVMAANPGCLCTLAPVWQLTRSSINNWSHGYAIQLVGNKGDFLHINVPIVDGKSQGGLMPLTCSRPHTSQKSEKNG